jgi:hypothetical protein
VDARLHHLQGKAELVTDLLPLLQEFYREKLTMYAPASAAARSSAHTTPTTPTQYIVNRETCS